MPTITTINSRSNYDWVVIIFFCKFSTPSRQRQKYTHKCAKSMTRVMCFAIGHENVFAMEKNTQCKMDKKAIKMLTTHIVLFYFCFLMLSLVYLFCICFEFYFSWQLKITCKNIFPVGTFDFVVVVKIPLRIVTHFMRNGHWSWTYVHNNANLW